MEMEDERGKLDLSRFPPLAEPIFHLRGTCNEFLLSEEIRKGMLNNICEENLRWRTERLKSVMYAQPYSSLTDTVISITHKLCHYFQLSHETKALSLDIFDRFCISLFNKINGILKATDPKRKLIRSNKALERLSEQSLLRLLSVIQIASKLTDRDKALTTKCVYKYLKKVGKCFSLAAITKSEARICKLVDHKLQAPTIYSAMESLLGLRRSRKLIYAASQTFAIAVHIIDMIYKLRSELYSTLFATLQIDDGKTKVDMEADTLWAGASVIIASLHFINCGLQEKAVEELSVDLQGYRAEYQLRAFSWILIWAFQK